MDLEVSSVEGAKRTIQTLEQEKGLLRQELVAHQDTSKSKVKKEKEEPEVFWSVCPESRIIRTALKVRRQWCPSIFCPDHGIPSWPRKMVFAVFRHRTLVEVFVVARKFLIVDTFGPGLLSREWSTQIVN
ncbi:hypothetical protein C8J57DRAFT_1254035 [Mycena rebaudengoi]|nr:hypothetical protein C8J57DRAFT_1254035 [Mycena rebaudengoi]